MSAPEHEIVVAAALAPPTGYAHAVIAAPGRVVYLGGQTAQGADGTILGASIPEQLDVAAANLVTALRAAGGEPHHLVSLLILVTDLAAYRASMAELGVVWRRHFGRRYPAMALAGVSGLFDELAKVELMGVAVIP